MANPNYSHLDGLASRSDENEAWVLDATRTEWNRINKGSHADGARELTKEEFEKLYPNIPPLPPEAFKA